MSSSRQKLGHWGEDRAAEHLVSLGYQIIARNARTPYGEIDLVARNDAEAEQGQIVFVEVKTRTTGSFGLPEQAITRLKREHMLNSALYFIQEHSELPMHWRFDVISIQRPKKGEPAVITVFENAIREED
jgi:putative endonuclease